MGKGEEMISNEHKCLRNWLKCLVIQQTNGISLTIGFGVEWSLIDYKN